MARVKKDREVNIVHFSFFDLLFGAFGAFVFLMIMHIINTINLVDVDLRNILDSVITEKNRLIKDLSKYQGIEQKYLMLDKKYQQSIAEREVINKERNALVTRLMEKEAKINTLQREVNSFAKIKSELDKRGDVLKTIKEENAALKQDLENAKRQLASINSVRMKINTTSFPTTITDEDVHLPISVEGGVPPYRWKLLGNLPSGLSFNEMTGIITGKTKKKGEFRFGIEVTDARGASALKTDIQMSVIERPVEKKRGVSPWFMVMTVICLLLLLYIMWNKYRIYKIVKKMEAEGWQLKWVR